MAGKVEAKRKALRARLIELARAHITTGGIGALRARTLAEEAGCSVGAIYTFFDDMNQLVMAVNGETFQALGAHVIQAVQAMEGDDPVDQLVCMGCAYLDYASGNPRVWRTLFDLDMSVDQPVPDWYMAELGKVFALIQAPLAVMTPEADAKALNLTTRALFSAVHGITLLGVERRISGVPQEDLELMIEHLIRRFCSGTVDRA